jgi:hypothetical protein
VLRRLASTSSVNLASDPNTIGSTASTTRPAGPRQQGAHLAAGGQEGGAGHPVGDHAGVLLGQAHQRHATHRVADQHHRAWLGHLVEHLPEILAELLQCAVRRVRGSGATMRALVIEHHPMPAPQREPLEVPAVEGEQVPVHEHQRGGIGRRTGGPVIRLVDLDMQADAIGG